MKDPVVVDAMISFLYIRTCSFDEANDDATDRLNDDAVERLIGQRSYSDVSCDARGRNEDEGEADGTLTFYAKLYAMAVEFGIPDLKQFAVDRF